MKLHTFQHVPFEGLASIGDWAEQKNHDLSFTLFYEEHPHPKLNAIDGLIIMGGPMGVDDEKKNPWLKEEKKLIEVALKKKIPILGICLGSQLLAQVLGAKVYKNKVKEIGWLPVQKAAHGQHHLVMKNLPHVFTPFHWHGDTFDLPHEALLLAASQECQHQAFIYNDNVLGLQFHLESNEASIAALIENCGEELKEKGKIQAEEKIKKEQSLWLEKNRSYMKSILETIF